MNVCVAVISNKNSPLYFKTLNQEESLSFKFRVYGTLDIIDDKVSSKSFKSSYTDKEVTHKYLGLLYPIDDHYIYGYITNTHIKFILIQESHSTAADLPKSNAPSHTDADIKSIFEEIHNAYIRLVSSPFYVPGTPIDPSLSCAARKFDQVIERILSVSPANSKP
ncbi:unnamed protein product [Rodentolepis nana]|uniref:Trafficking protein particle complex subunit 2-like protein n=1 Tax=Rodentolepis nana TaxID=102285 RepID=A0A0R3T4J2_RODNA|nr:unnamed protein product [Rodentolepis nana]